MASFATKTIKPANDNKGGHLNLLMTMKVDILGMGIILQKNK